MKDRYKGLHPYRFKDNPDEKKFAEEWAKQQQGHTLAYLLHLGEQNVRPPAPSVRDHIVAATVIQWLGSQVGQAFLRECGFERVKPAKPEKPAPKKKADGKKKCEAGTPFCSNSLVARYGVNGSEKEGVTFLFCGPCKVYLGKTSKVKAVT